MPTLPPRGATLLAAAATLALGTAALPAAAGAQAPIPNSAVYTQALVWQYQYFEHTDIDGKVWPSRYLAPIQYGTGACSAWGGGAGVTSSATTMSGCGFANNFGFVGVDGLPNPLAMEVAPGDPQQTGQAAGHARYDGGDAALGTSATMKARSQLSVDGFTLAPAHGTYGPDGLRVPDYEGQTAWDSDPDAIGVYSGVSLYDSFSVTSPGGLPAATLTLFLRWNGTLVGSSDFFSTYTSASAGFCTGPVGYCSSPNPDYQAQTFRGGATAYTYPGGGGDAVSTYGSAPVGFTAPEVIFSGTQSRGWDGVTASAEVDGWLTLANIPIGGTAPYDFQFWFNTWGEFNAYGIWGDTPITGDIDVDFAHSLEFAGAVAYDAEGRVIPDATISFATAANVPIGRPAGAPPPPPAPDLTAVPEPATALLLAAGLALLAAVGRRRAAERGAGS